MTWLDDLKPGDMVYIDGNGLTSARVDRTTKQHIFIGSSKFRRSDGCQTGEFSAWTVRPQLAEPNDITAGMFIAQQFQRQVHLACRRLARELERPTVAVHGPHLDKIEALLACLPPKGEPTR